MLAPKPAKQHPGSIHDMNDDHDLELLLLKMLTTTIHAGTQGRNPFAFKLAAICKDLGLSESTCEQLIHIWNAQYCKPSLDVLGISNTISSAYNGR